MLKIFMATSIIINLIIIFIVVGILVSATVNYIKNLIHDIRFERLISGKNDTMKGDER